MTAHLMPYTSQAFSSDHPWVEPDHDLLSLNQESQHDGICQSPAGFPASIEGPMAWSGAHDRELDQYIVELDGDDLAEIEEALESFKELDLNGDDVTRSVFPLPNLERRLAQCAWEVHYGSGLSTIRGLDPRRYSVEDNMVIFLGISSYIGNQRGVQSSKGAMISHVTESKLWALPREKRHGIHTNESLPFHCDMGTEILALHVRSCAHIGGRTCVASAGAIYNDLVRSNQSAVHVLAQPTWPILASSKQKIPYALSPLLEFQEGHLFLSMDPARIGPHPSASHGLVPPLTGEQEAALAELQNAARKHQVRLDNQPGDLVYINNWSVLHAREAYQDGETSSRHLVRLWLRNEALGWPVPDSMCDPWESAFGDKANAILNRSYPLAPMPIYMESKFTNGTAAFVADDDEPETSGQ